MSEGKLQCGNAGCRVAEDGKCLEGLDLAKCPFYGKLPGEIAAPPDTAAMDGPRRAQGVALSSSTTLDTTAASSCLRRLMSRVIAVVGTHDSGKTSLIAGLYDCFQMRVFNRVSFAGSSSLHAFEEACHDARAASLRNVAHSPRTKRGEVKFYHLDVKREGEEHVLTLLIADRSGEEYEEVTNDITIGLPMHEIRRAQTLTVLVDGERLCKGEFRHNAKSMVPLIVQGLIEGANIDDRPRLAVVLTKQDAVLASPHRDRVMKDFERMTVDLRTRFADVFTATEPFIVAASPKSSNVERGSGLSELLDFWLKDPDVAAVVPRQVHSDRIFFSLQVQGE